MYLQPPRYDVMLSMLFPELASRIATGYGHAWKTGGRHQLACEPSRGAHRQRSSQHGLYRHPAGLFD